MANRPYYNFDGYPSIKSNLYREVYVDPLPQPPQQGSAVTTKQSKETVNPTTLSPKTEQRREPSEARRSEAMKKFMKTTKTENAALASHKYPAQLSSGQHSMNGEGRRVSGKQQQDWDRPIYNTHNAGNRHWYHDTDRRPEVLHPKVLDHQSQEQAPRNHSGYGAQEGSWADNIDKITHVPRGKIPYNRYQGHEEQGNGGYNAENRHRPGVKRYLPNETPNNWYQGKEMQWDEKYNAEDTHQEGVITSAGERHWPEKMGAKTHVKHGKSEHVDATAYGLAEGSKRTQYFPYETEPEMLYPTTLKSTDEAVTNSAVDFTELEKYLMKYHKWYKQHLEPLKSRSWDKRKNEATHFFEGTIDVPRSQAATYRHLTTILEKHLEPMNIKGGKPIRGTGIKTLTDNEPLDYPIKPELPLEPNHVVLADPDPQHKKTNFFVESSELKQTILPEASVHLRQIIPSDPPPYLEQIIHKIHKNWSHERKLAPIQNPTTIPHQNSQPIPSCSIENLSLHSKKSQPDKPCQPETPHLPRQLKITRLKKFNRQPTKPQLPNLPSFKKSMSLRKLLHINALKLHKNRPSSPKQEQTILQFNPADKTSEQTSLETTKTNSHSPTIMSTSATVTLETEYAISTLTTGEQLQTDTRKTP